MNLEGDKLEGNNFVCQVCQNNLKVLDVNLEGEDNVNKLPHIHTLNKVAKFRNCDDVVQIDLGVLGLHYT